MKILWLCNVALPQIARELKFEQAYGGGWLEGLSRKLVQSEDIDLTVCFPYMKANNCVFGNCENLKYIGFKNSGENTKLFKDILNQCHPDVVHIFGTEEKHTYDMVMACEQSDILDKTVISIQGLVSVYADHYFAGLSRKVVNSWTIRGLLKKNNIAKGKQRFIRKGRYEIEAIKRVRHVIGRTEWDVACVSRINPNVKYHFCNETLRDVFYENKWSYNKCEKHTIFVSQCSYPIKGFHKLLEAVPDICKEFPDFHIYTTGKSPVKKWIIRKIVCTSYQAYLAKLIKKYGIEEKITFLGNLDAEHMREQYLRANVFVSPSSIENSPNSLGEAMLLGVPCVTTDVGGVKDMIVHGKEGYMYPFDEPYIAAYYIKQIFNSVDLSERFSKNARKHAKQTHCKEINNNTLINIYRELNQTPKFSGRGSISI